MIVVYRPATAFFIELPRVRSTMYRSESDRHVDLFYFVVLLAVLSLPLHALHARCASNGSRLILQ